MTFWGNANVKCVMCVRGGPAFHEVPFWTFNLNFMSFFVFALNIPNMCENIPFYVFNVTI